MSNQKKQNFHLFFALLFQSGAEVTFITFVVFFLLEYFKNGIITNYFNFNILLILAIFFGMLTLILASDFSQPKKKKIFLIPAIVSLAAGVAVYNILPETFKLYQFVPWLVIILSLIIFRLIQKND